MTTLTAPLSPASQVFALLLKPLIALVQIADSVRQIKTASHEADRLMMLSDAALAEKGLERSDVIAHAFRSYLTRD